MVNLTLMMRKYNKKQQQQTNKQLHIFQLNSY